MEASFKRPPLPELMRSAESEDWEKVDELLPQASNKSFVLRWSVTQGMSNPNSNLRDLAVSILEKSDHELNPEIKQKLAELMDQDPNPYVQYRSAFARVKRGDTSQEVLDKLKQALSDPDVSEIARGYLSNLEI